MSSIPIVETAVNLILAIMQDGGLLALVALMAVESWGLPPLPSEVILPFAGFLVAEGAYSFPLAVVAALVGGLIGSYAAYAVGRWGRNWLIRDRPGPFRLDPKHLEMMDRWFARRGEGTVLVARLLPIVRSYISYPAGTARMSPTRFGVFTTIGATPFTAGLIYAGVLLGKNWTSILPFLNYLDYVAIVFIVGAVTYIALRWRGVITSGFPPKWNVDRGAPPNP